MAEIAGLLVRLEATTALLRNEMRNAERQVDTTAKRIERDVFRIDDAISNLGANMASALKGGLAGLAAGLTVGAIGAVTRETLGYAKELKLAADASGMSVEAFQRLDGALQQTGLKAGDFADAITEFLPNLGDAIVSGGDTADMFDKLGIKLRDGAGQVRSTESVLMDFADALSRIEDPAVRVAAASKLFGEENGPKMAVALSKGSAAIKTLGSDIEVVSKALIDRAVEIDKEWEAMTTRLGTRMKSTLLEIVVAARDTTGEIAALFGKGTLDAQIDSLRSLIQGYKDMGPILSGISLGASATVGGAGSIRELEEQLRRLEARRAMIGKPAAPISGEDPNARPASPPAATNKPLVLETPEQKAARETAEREAEAARKRAASAAEAEAKRKADAIKRTTDALRVETSEYGLQAEEIERNARLREAGTTAHSAEGREIVRLVALKYEQLRAEELWNDEREKGNERQQAANDLLVRSRTPLEAYTLEVERLVRLLEAGDIDEGLFQKSVLIASEQMKEAQEKAKTVTAEVEFLRDIGAQAFDRIGRGITEAFASGENAAVSFKSVGLAVVSELMQAFIELAAINPIKNALLGTAEATLSGVAAGAGGWFTGAPTITRTGRAQLSGDIYKVPDLLPKRAAGGPARAGEPLIVGEFRPELFVPSVSGNIKPYLPSMGGAGAARSAAPATNVTQHLNFALGVSSTVRAEVANMMPQIAQASRAAMLEAQARRGRSL